MSVLLSLYRSAGFLAAPLLRRHLRKRVDQGKENPERLTERDGIASAVRPEGKVIWIHAASVGESLSALPLIDALRAEYPGLTALVTTGTTTSAELIARRAPDVIHQFAPIDTVKAVRQFLDHWSPDGALWMESELWPVLVTEVQRRGIPSALVNGRISKTSARNWKFARAVAREILSSFDVCLAQTDAVKRRLLALGASAHATYVTGDLKASRPPERPDEDMLWIVSERIGERPVWLAASTHPGEEEAAAKTHLALLKHFPRMLMILAPRHPNRGDEIAAIMRQHGLSVRQRSSEGDQFDCQVYIADTLGDMPIWYAAAPITYVGAGWDNLGGHNPLEPAQVGSAVLSGPRVANFAKAYTDLMAADAVQFVDDGAALTAALRTLTDDEGYPNQTAKAMARAGRYAAAPDPDPLQKTLDRLRPLFDKALS